MKESNDIGKILFGLALGLLFFDVLANYRWYHQVTGGGFESLLIPGLKGVFGVILSIFSFFGLKWSMLVIRLALTIFILLYFKGQPASDVEPTKTNYIVGITSFFLVILSFLISPFWAIQNHHATGQPDFLISAEVYAVIMFVVFIVMHQHLKVIARAFSLGGSSSSMKKEAQNDPFGRKDRAFTQVTHKIENEDSVNIEYTFLNTKFEREKGYINVVNPYRAAMVIGTPGSGKSFAILLQAIQQFIRKGFTMIVYDFKFPELTKFTYNCLLQYGDEIKKKTGKVPELKYIYFDDPKYSARCNVMQPAMLKDFAIGAYGVADAFMVALNRSWATKEGDFFPESAKNITAGCIWALKIYKGGKYCTVPHLIEFLSLPTGQVIDILIALKDTSLKNVIKPFEEAKLDKAMEQLQGQMGTVRIALSRLTSRVTYWNLTEPEGATPFRLDVNSKDNPQILCLGNSMENQRVNNIFLSLFIVQLFRLVNVKGRRSLGVMLDECVTLSFPKGMLDTLIATARSNKISVWLGFQDLSQLIRDFTKDVAETLFKMIGNVFSGTVEDDTGERMQKRLGKIKIVKKNVSVGASGEPSFSFSTNEDYAVPSHFFGQFTQGTFAGKIADNIDQPIDPKIFYGDINYTFPFDKMEEIPMDAYWKNVIERDCKGFSTEQIDEYVGKILDMNLERVVSEIENMRDEILGTGVAA